MTSNQENRAALARERQARQSAYLAAVAERDALPADADHGPRRHAEARVNSARRALDFWSDPIPAASTANEITAPATPAAPRERPGAVSPTIAAERTRAKAIIAAGKRLNLHGDTIQEAILSGVNAEKFVKAFEVEALARQIASH